MRGNMEVNSKAKIESKILSFSESKILSNLLRDKNQLLEYTVVAIITDFIIPSESDNNIKNILKVKEYNSVTLLTNNEIKKFCTDYFILVERWVERIKLKEKGYPNLERISKKYNLDKLTELV